MQSSPQTAKSPSVAAVEFGLDSDYGSDIDVAGPWEPVLQQTLLDRSLVLEHIEEHDPLPHVVHAPRWIAHLKRPRQSNHGSNSRGSGSGNGHIPWSPQTCVENDDDTTSQDAPLRSKLRFFEEADIVDESATERRTPLERFRTAPKKPLSVTDLVSPAWCELKYWYSLTKHGRVKKTPAMRQGSVIHKVLEEQVHTTVPVDLITKEDAFGLRIFNVIQGLRVLRATGLTREFEVWAVIDGQIINGVIDELSTECPDVQLEAKLAEAAATQSMMAKPLPPDQTTMHQFLIGKSSPGSTAPPATQTTELSHPVQKIYLTDVKTRVNNKVPSSGPALRPPYMQLMLYRKLLTIMVSGSIDSERLFERYGLNSQATFSDTFITQVGGLDLSADKSNEGPNDSIGELLEHNQLSKLWDLLMRECRMTFTVTNTDSSLGHVMRVEYRGAVTGEVIGSKVFAFNQKAINTYTAKEMAWWKGDRPAVGVDVEEAFKCQSCEFAEVCSWRKEKVESSIVKARFRNAKETEDRK